VSRPAEARAGCRRPRGSTPDRRVVVIQLALGQLDKGVVRTPRSLSFESTANPTRRGHPRVPGKGSRPAGHRRSRQRPVWPSTALTVTRVSRMLGRPRIRGVNGDSLLGHRARVPRRPPVTAAAGSMQGGIGASRRASGPFQALIRISAWNDGDMRGWFDRVSGALAGPNPNMQGIRCEAADGIRTHDLLHGNYTGHP
jgi:hypothetical protein